jgi:hypothetical protein
MPEWLMGADCKSAGYAYAGSNPARPIQRLFWILDFGLLSDPSSKIQIPKLPARIAQW